MLVCLALPCSFWKVEGQPACSLPKHTRACLLLCTSHLQKIPGPHLCKQTPSSKLCFIKEYHSL